MRAGFWGEGGGGGDVCKGGGGCLVVDRVLVKDAQLQHAQVGYWQSLLGT